MRGLIQFEAIGNRFGHVKPAHCVCSYAVSEISYMQPMPLAATAAHRPASLAANDRTIGHAVSRSFTIAAASSPASRYAANLLLKERYNWRGYDNVSLPQPESITHFPLTATHEGTVIGTLTVGVDGPMGLNCDRAFAPEVDSLRQTGAKLCEFTKLAIDPSFGGKHVLAALFHVAYLAADRLADVDTLLMEVNPRHVRYYSRMLGATVVGDERTNQHVNAPAVLLSMAFADVRDKIDAIAGSPNLVGGERSLYSLAFNRHEEEAIVSRLIRRAPLGDDEAPFGFRMPRSQIAAGADH